MLVLSKKQTGVIYYNMAIINVKAIYRREK